MTTMQELEAQGFDDCAMGRNSVRVGCSQCEALVLNGTPRHERGCPNTVKPCRECGNYGDPNCCNEVEP